MKISDEMKRVIKELAKGMGVIVYYKGGFWAPPGQPVDAQSGAPGSWHTTTQTIKSMTRRGLLQSLPTSTHYAGNADLSDHKLTALALTFVGPVAFHTKGGGE